jgi:hypothetical protein
MDSLGSDVRTMREMVAARRERATRVRLANPWSPACCQEGVCDGTYAGTNPDDGRPERIMCLNHDTPECPRRAAAISAVRTAWFRQAGFGPRYDAPDAERVPIRELIDDYLADWPANLANGRGLLISGGVGVGKTMTLAYIALRLYEAGFRDVDCQFAPSLFDKLHRDASMTQHFARIGLLMIDDLGVEYRGEWSMARFAELVEFRHSSLAPVIVTTNLSTDSLMHQPELGRIIDRWRQSCAALTLAGESQRVRAA